MGEEVIELSIEETNALRVKLGMLPLRAGGGSSIETSNTSKDNAEISLSIIETNTLRSRLGLRPLQVSDEKIYSSPIHIPAENTRDLNEVKRRLEEERLKREVERGIKKFQNEEKKEANDLDALSWAQKMRIQLKTSENVKATKSAKEEASTLNKNIYSGEDFDDQNLIVTHSVEDFNAGDSIILTLADKTIMEAEENEGTNELENVNMTESAAMKENLKRKRMMEMRHGHAGGYTGYDDDEFEELGGSEMNSGIIAGNRDVNEKKNEKRGFKLSKDNYSKIELESQKKDNFANFSGKEESLDTNQVNIVHQADFLTCEEEETLEFYSFNKGDIESRRKKKNQKMLKKLKKERKKLKDIFHKPHAEVDLLSEKNHGSNLLQDLLNSSSLQIKGNKTKRRRKIQNDDSDDEEIRNDGFKEVCLEKMENIEQEVHNIRNEKYNKIMEKGNERSKRLFGITPNTTGSFKSEIDDETSDDAILQAAISKARRLNRLKELSSGSKDILNPLNSVDRYADEVLQSLQAAQKTLMVDITPVISHSSNRIVFESSETTDFTMALRSKKSSFIRSTSITAKSTPEAQKTNMDDNNAVKDLNEPHKDNTAVSEDLHDETLQELSSQIGDDHPDGAFCSTANSFVVGRGMSACISWLKQTGEISSRNAGKEELHGRAKDEKTYDDYKPLDLKDVIKIDTTGLFGKPNEKDIELANREIKLEYRDEHGRLLTRKEAYRQLCYQFHGHGASKKKEEKRMQQTEREIKERSSQASTVTLQSLKAAQKASGNAFIIHKA